MGEPAGNNSEAILHRREFEKRVKAQNALAAKPNGPGIPKGSFLESCRGCSMDGNVLTCTHCSNPSMAPTSATLRTNKCPLDLVDNDDGALICAPEDNDANIPAGGYQGSCRGCKVRGMVLRCTHCSKAAGGPRDTEMVVSRCPKPYLVNNNNGNLVCEGIPNDPNIPQGGYSGSCQGCKLEDGGKMLRCSHCFTSERRQLESTISLELCPRPSKVDNNNGNLVCQGLPNSDNIPEGGYRNSCSGCQLEDGGARLRCSHCFNAMGEQRLSDLDLTKCARPLDVDNQDGKMTCAAGSAEEVDDLWQVDGKLPIGGYRDSCSGCRMDGDSLTCARCKKADGSEAEASNAKAGRCRSPGSISNKDGKLVCTKKT